MKKTFSFLMLIILLFASCSNDDDNNNNGTTPTSSNTLWYGTQLPTSGETSKNKLWDQKTGISVKFINEPSDAAMIDSIRRIASQWLDHAGIFFNYVGPNEDADVRIAFDWQGNDWLTWSYVGTDAKTVTNQNEPTAVLAGLQKLSQKELEGNVLRLYGQILGLEYELRSQASNENGNWKNESQVENYWKEQFSDYKISWDVIRKYVFSPIVANNTNPLYPDKEVDQLSIMVWPHYNIKVSNNIEANTSLSEGDKAFIAILYPRETAPTIQTAWVDAGYFEWTDATKTAVRITKLGAEQEYLPNVSDGEQLTSGNRMFNPPSPSSSKLKRAPWFNASNITDFSEMFFGCDSFVSIPVLDTSKGTDFFAMFCECHSLVSIPALDMSNGINFEATFASCISLTTIPKLNTSKGTNFSFMFESCNALITIPLIDTSKGTNFRLMFDACYSLTSLPLLNTSNGEIFSLMFWGCKSLTSMPLLDTSNGTDFYMMFVDCMSLTSIPLLNTSNGIIFDYMFKMCSSIKTIPLLDTSNGGGFVGMFSGCTSLEYIPQLDTSNGSDFYCMFEDCKSLKIKPQLDLSKATRTIYMFRGTPFENDPL